MTRGNKVHYSSMSALIMENNNRHGILHFKLNEKPLVLLFSFCLTLHQKYSMSVAQGCLQHRPGEEHFFWGDAVGVALPCVKQATIPRALLLSRATTTEKRNTQKDIDQDTEKKNREAGKTSLPQAAETQL